LEPRKLGDGFAEPMVPALPVAVAPAALAGSTEPNASEKLRQLLDDLNTHHRSPVPKRPIRQTLPPKAALAGVPSAAELAEHESKKAAALSQLKAAFHQVNAPAEPLAEVRGVLADRIVASTG